jgi:hemolysin III
MSPVPVQYNPDVLGETVPIETGEKIALVDAVEETECHIRLIMVPLTSRFPVEPNDSTCHLTAISSPGIERMTFGRMQNPIRGLLHGAAAVAALIGTVYLVSQTWGNAAALIGSFVFGSALLVMYTISTLYHSVPWRVDWKRRLQRIDHSMIYLVVAGTFTPIAIAGLQGAAMWWCLGLVWGIAIVGITLKLMLPSPATGLSVTLQLVMGWTVILWIPQFWSSLGAGAIVFIAVGGLFYTTGSVIFLTKRPKLFPRTFSYHELFHSFVVVASVFHFLAIALYAVPAATM